ncbi:igV_TCR_alpha and Ig domain-containing protein isoform X9 [Scomber scombrus]
MRIKSVSLISGLCIWVSYCVSGLSNSKLTFGSGSRLIVGSEEVFEPSYFILTDPGDDNKTSIGSWCLATGFTQQNITNNKTNWDLFNKTEAVRIDGDSLYNEVVPLAPGTNDTSG